MNIKSLIDNPSVSNIVFYPRKSSIPKMTVPNVKVLQLKINNQITIGGFFYLNDPELPIILLFHGNGEIASDYQYFASKFFDCEVNLAVVDFRGYGFSSGKPYYTSLISDALPVFEEFKEWIENNSLSQSIFVQGRSLGSTCAAEIGSHNPENLKGIIFESGFASTYNMMTRLFRISSPNLTPLSLNKYSNDTRLKKFTKPVLIIHGTNDWIIPPSEGELIFQNLPATIQKQLIMIEGAGHNDILNYKEEYFKPLRNFTKIYK